MACQQFQIDDKGIEATKIDELRAIIAIVSFEPVAEYAPNKTSALLLGYFGQLVARFY